jgi:hypothetical protein
MSGAIPPLLQYAFIAWCSVKAQGQLLPLHLDDNFELVLKGKDDDPLPKSYAIMSFMK